MSMTVKYSHNNSGGSWWLKDKDWENLEAAGWEVEWFSSKKVLDSYKTYGLDGFLTNGRFLGARARSATYKADHDNLYEVIRGWEKATGQNATALGCYSCCGPPHSFTVTYDNGRQVYLHPEPNGSSLVPW